MRVVSECLLYFTTVITYKYLRFINRNMQGNDIEITMLTVLTIPLFYSIISFFSITLFRLENDRVVSLYVTVTVGSVTLSVLV